MLGKVKYGKEAPDVLPVHALIEECKLKILEHRLKKPQFQLGMGPDKCSSVKCPGTSSTF